MITGPEMLEELDRRGKPDGVTPLLIDMRRLDLPANSLDAIWASAVLIHLVTDDLAETLERLHRSLKPGGVIMANFAISNLGLRHERIGELEHWTSNRTRCVSASGLRLRRCVCVCVCVC